MVSYSLTRKACYISYFVQAITLNIEPLFFVIFSENYGLSSTELGFLVLFNFTVQMCVDLLSIKFIEKFGYKVSAVTANTLAFLGVLGLSVLPMIMPPVIGLVIAVFLYSIGAGLIEVAINPIIEALPTDNLGASMSILHSFYSWGQTAIILVTTVILLFIGDGYWYILPIIWSLVPFVNAILFIKAPMIDYVGSGEGSGIKAMMRNRMFYVFLLLMVCGGSCEMVISQWASYFAEKGLGVSKILGDLLGPCIFALMMAIGRTFYGKFGTRLPIIKALTACAFIGVAAYAGIALIPSPGLVMICFALVGIASSLMWPGTLAAAADRMPHGGTPMFAFLALAGDVGCSVGPWASGVVNDITAKTGVPFMSALGFTGEQAALRCAILALGVFPFIMLVTLLFIKRKRKDTSV